MGDDRRSDQSRRDDLHSRLAPGIVDRANRPKAHLLPHYRNIGFFDIGFPDLFD
jgi:hypothetical protein